MKSAAEPVGFAVFLGFIMLLSVLVEAVVSLDWAAVFIHVVLTLRRALGLFAPAVLSVNLLEELRVGFVASLPFGVRLRALLNATPVFILSHLTPRGLRSSGTAARRIG
jgi:hypothetical protein